MKSLLEYASSQWPDIQLINTDSDFFSDSQTYIDLIHTSLIERTTNTSIPSSVLAANISYEDAIDEAIRCLLIEKANNVITNGYSLDLISSVVYCKDSNFHVNHLKNDLWSLLHSRIGSRGFFDLIFNCVCFMNIGNGNRVQMFGPTKSFVTQRENFISKHQMLYHSMKSTQNIHPVPTSAFLFLQEIFVTEKFDAKKGIPKKYRAIGRICKEIIKRKHKSRAVYFIEVTCPIPKMGDYESNTDYATPKRQVIKFLITIFHEIFPDNFWGSNHNKQVIINKVIQYINGSKTEKIAVYSLTENIKLKEISWLGKTSEYNINKQDFMKRTHVLSSFTAWLFSTFLPKIIGVYFHVTECSAIPGLLYFRHDIWRKISNPFKRSYFEAFLERHTYDKLNYDKEKLNDMIYSIFPFQGKLRLLPKKKDFRLICMPLKDKRQKFTYINHLNSEIKPVREILRYLRRTSPHKQPRCLSISDICTNIKKFKLRLQAKYGALPQIYFTKFDIKQCYDTIPKNKVLEVVCHLLHDQKLFLFRPLSITNISRRNFNRRAIIMESVESSNFDLIENGTNDNFQNKLIIDKVKTVCISSREIVQIIEKQLENSALRYGQNTLYSRRNGIFQGLPLSATFCDLVYDDLIDRYLKSTDSSESIVLRLADDFLVLSPSEDKCKEILGKLQRGFSEYKAQINSMKTTANISITDSQTCGKLKEILFCGLTINIETLTITKVYDRATAAMQIV